VSPNTQNDALKSFLKSMVTDNNRGVMEAIAYGYATIFEEIDTEAETITIPLPTDPQGVDKVNEEISTELKAYRDAAEVTKGAMAAQTQAEDTLRNTTDEITSDYEREKESQSRSLSGDVL